LIANLGFELGISSALQKKLSTVKDRVLTNPVAPMTDVGIQQLNLSYVSEQDRLLFKVGLSDNNELSVWLTYRISRMLWQLLSPDAHIPSATSASVTAAPQLAVKQFEQEVQAVETLQKMNFKTPYTARTESVSQQPLLVTNAVIQSDNGNSKALDMPCLEGMNVRINLNNEMMLAICSMLQVAAHEAGWDLGKTVALTLNSPAIMLESDSKVIH
jgi:hypothetical protein